MEKQLSIIEQYKESHHAVAKMFACGMVPAMIRRQTGYSMRRLTLLWSDPTFQELIAHYRARVEEKWEQNVDAYTDLAVGNMIAAERQISDKLAEADDLGETLPTRELIAIASDRADRFGYSKHTVHHHEHDFAAALDRAIARSGKAEPKQIEEQALEVHPAQPMPPLREAQIIPAVKSEPRSFSAVLKRRKVA